MHGFCIQQDNLSSSAFQDSTEYTPTEKYAEKISPKVFFHLTNP